MFTREALIACVMITASSAASAQSGGTTGAETPAVQAARLAEECRPYAEASPYHGACVNMCTRVVQGFGSGATAESSASMLKLCVDMHKAAFSRPPAPVQSGVAAKTPTPAPETTTPAAPTVSVPAAQPASTDTADLIAELGGLQTTCETFAESQYGGYRRGCMLACEQVLRRLKTVTGISAAANGPAIERCRDQYERAERSNTAAQTGQYPAYIKSLVDECAAFPDRVGEGCARSCKQSGDGLAQGTNRNQSPADYVAICEGHHAQTLRSLPQSGPSESAQQLKAVSSAAQNLITSGRIGEMARECRTMTTPSAQTCVGLCERVERNHAAGANVPLSWVSMCETSYLEAKKPAP